MRFPRCVVVLAALVVVACQSGGGGPVAQGTPLPACQIEQAAELPARLLGGHILVPAAINNTPVQMVVDTGAMTTMLTPSAVALLGLPTDPFRTTTVHGIGGTVVTHNTSIQSFRLGKEDWLGSTMATGRLPEVYRVDPPVVGLLGADRLGAFDVELDLPRQRMVLWRIRNCNDDFVPWQEPHYALRLARYLPYRMVTHVEIDGHPVTALVDWGARSTTLTTRAAARIGVTQEMLAQDRSGASRGVDLNEVELHAHRFAEVAIGPAHFHNIALEVADLRVEDIGMLLGADYVARRHVWLSYATNQLFVMRQGSPVAANAVP